MARHTYVSEDYYNYNDHEDGYAYGPAPPANYYVVETTTVERVCVPATSYTRFGGGPLRHGSSYEKSSPPHYQEVDESFMANFLNKIQIEASRPTDKYTHTSLNKYQHTSTNEYRYTSPDKHRPTDPKWHHPTSPEKYQHTNPNKYFWPTDPNTYQTTSPNKYRHPSPDKYRHRSLDRYQHTSPDKYRYRSPNNDRHASPYKYQRTSPDKYHPTISEKYWHRSPTRIHPSKEDQLIRAQNYPDYGPISPTHRQPSQEGGQHARLGNLSGLNYPWHSVGRPTTRHPLTKPTTDIKEAFSILVESVNNLEVENLAFRAQSIEHERHYTSRSFGGAGAITQPYVTQLIVKKP